MEAYFNFVKQVIGRRVLAEQCNEKAIKQSVSWKANSAIFHPINEHLVLNFAQQRNQVVTLLVLDATFCSNRNASPIVSLSFQRCELAETS